MRMRWHKILKTEAHTRSTNTKSKKINPNKQNSVILKQWTKTISNKMGISQSTNPKLRERQMIMNKSSNLNKFI